MFSYIESRGGEYRATLMVGLQMTLQKYFRKPITMTQVEEAREFFEAHGEPFPYDGWKYVVEKLNGIIPLRIRAVPEGLLVPTGNVLVTVESTDENCFWMVGWMETKLMRIWFPITVATQSFFIKEIILDALKQSSDDPMGEINFKLHDFGSRGTSSSESAAIGGAAHLANFMGSDTCIGIRQANFYYNCKMSAFQSKLLSTQRLLVGAESMK
jgi:Nicotinic acid phosphoribosyltransferase